MKVKDKVIVVTGGGNGIGRELVLSLLRKGSRVAALDISREALEQTKDLVCEEQRERLSLHTVNIGEKTRWTIYLNRSLKFTVALMP
jgi:NAD(P)-dependent dehydrogenase (short-subunit alcohol dehydrogenase family)